MTWDNLASGVIGAVLGTIGGAVGAYYGLRIAVALNRAETRHLRKTIEQFAETFGQHVERLDKTANTLSDRLWELTKSEGERRQRPR